MNTTFHYKTELKGFRKQLDHRVAEYVRLHPELRLSDIAKEFALSLESVCAIMLREGVRRGSGNRFGRRGQ